MGGGAPIKWRATIRHTGNAMPHTGAENGDRDRQPTLYGADDGA